MHQTVLFILSVLGPLVPQGHETARRKRAGDRGAARTVKKTNPDYAKEGKSPSNS